MLPGCGGSQRVPVGPSGSPAHLREPPGDPALIPAGPSGVCTSASQWIPVDPRDPGLVGTPWGPRTPPGSQPALHGHPAVDPGSGSRSGSQGSWGAGLVGTPRGVPGDPTSPGDPSRALVVASQQIPGRIPHQIPGIPGAGVVGMTPGCHH